MVIPMYFTIKLFKIIWHGCSESERLKNCWKWCFLCGPNQGHITRAISSAVADSVLAWRELHYSQNRETVKYLGESVGLGTKNWLLVWRLNCCWHSSAQSFFVSGLVEIYDQEFCSLLCVYVFRNGASSSTKEGSVFICRRYVGCTVVGEPVEYESIALLLLQPFRSIVVVFPVSLFCMDLPSL
jgi:hypothetical protein